MHWPSEKKAVGWLVPVQPGSAKTTTSMPHFASAEVAQEQDGHVEPAGAMNPTPPSTPAFGQEPPQFGMSPKLNWTGPIQGDGGLGRHS
jgi:hypothetical protein